MPLLYNLDYLDDPVQPDGCPEFSGGQFSNWRANLLQPNQSQILWNCDFDKLGKIRTRRGTVNVTNITGGNPYGQVGPASGPFGTQIQGLTTFQTALYNYIVAANNGKIWSLQGGAWQQIALGGAVDNDQVYIGRKGQIDQSTVPTGYAIGDTVLVVDGITGIVGVGEKLYFMNNLRTDYWEYTIASHLETTGNTTTITLEEPGLVFPVKDNWKFTVLRPANVDIGGGSYPATTTTINIKNYGGADGGEVKNGEIFVIKSENVNHTISAHAPVGSGPTTSLTFSPGLLGAYSASPTVPIVFAQGNDQLFWCDGTQAIYGWNGLTALKLGNISLLDQLTGSTLGAARTVPPVGPKILVWFQSRLVASGIAAEPDAVYFSDILNPTAWDKDYQQLRVGGGESDPITAIVPWMDLYLVVFKKNSIYIVNCDPAQNPDPTDPTLLVASFAIKQLHRRIGCPAPGTAVQVGGSSASPGSDIFFLDDNKKVRSVRRVLAAETQQELAQPISLAVQDELDLINIDAIGKCSAAYHSDHYILSFPAVYGGVAATLPNYSLAYNLLTQTWCGVWYGWAPTCFAVRTDLGDQNKMIFGQWDAFASGHVGGTVSQWLDDLGFQDETTTTYQDMGVDIDTRIITRAMTFGDPFGNKTGLNVEFEFDESTATSVLVQVILDKVTQVHAIAYPFSSSSARPVRLPVVLPFTLSVEPSLLRLAFDLQRYGTFRELQFMLTTTAGKLSLRSIRITGFADTLKLQTNPGSLPEHLPAAPQ